MLGAGKRAATVVALHKCDLFELSSAALQQLLEHFPKVEEMLAIFVPTGGGKPGEDQRGAGGAGGRATPPRRPLRLDHLQGTLVTRIAESHAEMGSEDPHLGTPSQGTLVSRIAESHADMGPEGPHLGIPSPPSSPPPYRLRAEGDPSPPEPSASPSTADTSQRTPTKGSPPPRPRPRRIDYARRASHPRQSPAHPRPARIVSLGTQRATARCWRPSALATLGTLSRRPLAPSVSGWWCWCWLW